MKRKALSRLQLKPLRIVWMLSRFVIIFGLCFVILYPVIKKLSSAVMSEQDLFDSTVVYVAKHFTVDNFKTAFKGMDFMKSFSNTLLLSTMSGLLQLGACTMIAYGFARFQFPLKKFLFALVILTIIVPPTTFQLPQYMTFRYFDLFGILKALTGNTKNTINTPIPFILLSITGMGFKNGLFIYLLRQFFKGIPKELEESAFVDGAGSFRTFVRIILPNAVPMMVTVFLFSFVWQWTDTYYTGLYYESTATLASSLNMLSYNIAQQYGTVAGTMSFMSSGYESMVNNAGVLLCILPLILLYIGMQKSFVESISRSGLTG